MTLKISIGALLALSLLLILRQYKPEWAPVLRTGAAVCFLTAALSLAAGLVGDLEVLFGSVLPGETRTVMLRSLGLCLLTECAAGVCRDSGEASLAGWVEYAGRLELLVTAVPLIRAVMETVVSLCGTGGAA